MKISGPLEFCELRNDITATVTKQTDFWSIGGPSELWQSLDWNLKQVKHFKAGSFHKIRYISTAHFLYLLLN